MALRRRQRLGQYRIEAHLAAGGFGDVYRAYDTVEGVRVALKVPHEPLLDRAARDRFRREVRTVAQLDHPNILPIKTAGVVDGTFVIVTPMGIESLADRLRRRAARVTVLSWFEQMLAALAYAHQRKIAHLDLKPDNLILFPENRLRLADFGLARVAARTISGSGSGTVGYLAPEQALGKPNLRSDVFCAGLLAWRMFSGHVPEWPFRWPFPNAERVQRGYRPALVRIIRQAVVVDESKRYASAVPMLAELEKIKDQALR